MADQFANTRARLSKRLDRFNSISSGLSSTNKKARQAAQRTLKSLGRYNGPIDGNQGKGTTAALKAMRRAIGADQAKLDKRVSNFNANALQKRADKFAASKQKAKAAKQKSDSEASKATRQTVLLSTSIAGGLVMAGKEVKNLDAKDKLAVKARNTELKRVNTQLEKIKSSKGAKLKNGQFSAATKKRLFSVAKSAKKQGLTKFKPPLGVGKGLLLLTEAVGARVLAETAFKDNETARSTLHAISTGIGIYAVAPSVTRTAARVTTPHLLNAGHITNIDDAHALGKPVKKAAKVAKAPKSVARKVLNVVGKGLSKVAPVITVAAATYTAYSVYKATGDVAKAATAGADDLTMGAVTRLKTSHAKAQKASKGISTRRAQIATMRINNRKSVSGLLRAAKPLNVAPVKTTRGRRAAGRTSAPTGVVKSHYRTVGSKRIRVRSFKRKAS